MLDQVVEKNVDAACKVKARKSRAARRAKALEPEETMDANMTQDARKAAADKALATIWFVGHLSSPDVWAQ